MCGANSRALVATSSSGWCQQYAAEFLKHGLDVHTASSAQEALSVVRNHVYRYVLLDDSLPDMDVVELCFNLCELVADQPTLWIAASPEHCPPSFESYCGVSFIGDRPELLKHLHAHLSGQCD